MNRYYNQLMNLQESAEFKQLITKWNTLSENIKNVPFTTPILLPDMFLIAKSGAGITNMLHCMAEYLSAQNNLMEFYGDVKFFEFNLSYAPPSGDFTDMKRLISEVSNAAGFRSEFKGIVHIEIDEWVSHYNEKHFISFMEYLADHSDKWLIVLSVSPDYGAAIHNLEAFLSMYLRIEKVTLTLPKTEDLFEDIQKKLYNYNLHLNADAKDLLYETIECLRKNPYFDGYKTIKSLCQDIVYTIYSTQITDSKVLTKEMLMDFSVDSSYVKRTIFNLEKVNKIGFFHEGD